ncbi:hypothetical protein [Ohtaekwangia koreensis]|jgi:hypothetical protein|uniref:Uncharacterized protein n=1 Tax=Ohtaekwangia koreensis TaxID=688867 RepID=A0A1T5JST9_9BACT|nr:hypothetical protein [Ohtaekwangia koreensis]SKC54424.1 hypothetical protein SAMN05660236_1444 [Ohtaekwangia koreensis]
MEESAFDKIDIFLTVDRQTINNYFNSHDPAPIYKRQLSHQLEEYIRTSVLSAKRYSAIFYKFKCISEIDKQYAMPLMYAIRTHYLKKKEMREKEFKRFRNRSWILLGISLVMVLICQGFIPMMLDEHNRLHTALGNSLDIFSWVLLWRPIDLLLFYWNPHLKDISLLNKLATAELIVIDNEK